MGLVGGFRASLRVRFAMGVRSLGAGSVFCVLISVHEFLDVDLLAI